MTDKSFGDHLNRNIVKNSLLSTAVTGLSIEDLTHNAVLLPVSQGQELITRQDHAAQNVTLGHPIGTHNAALKYPSGVANPNLYPSNQPQNIIPTYPSSNQPPKIDYSSEISSSTQSKASVKSDDDFDVNEYFARLQSTRYVSAPLNSSMKEDNNANIDAEENLEEINLNEDKSQVDVQQSITADIAQNFSQLPTVLPQVASAVFSSFSNMLNYKREPDEVKYAYQEEKREVVQSAPLGLSETAQSAPLMGVSEMKEVAPPPLMQPPQLTGSTNYRLLTKKKYAQIPGLSSGESRQIPTFTPINHSPMSSNYFVPSLSGNTETHVATDLEKKDSNINIMILADKTVDDKETMIDSNSFSIPNIPMSNVGHINVQSQGSKQANVFAPMYDQTPKDAIQSTQYSQNLTQTNVESGSAIIPPPPMFSNTNRDSLSSTGNSVLPPSVARRVSANQPLIKPPISVPRFVPTNIFTPTSDVTAESNTQMTSHTKGSSNFDHYSQMHKVANLPPTESSSEYSNSLPSMSANSVQVAPITAIPLQSLPPPPMSNLPPFSSNTAASFSTKNTQMPPYSAVSNITPTLFNPVTSTVSQQNTVEAPVPGGTHIATGVPQAIGNTNPETYKLTEIQPSIFTPNIDQQSQSETITPPTFFNPNLYSSTANVPNEPNTTESSISFILESRAPPEPQIPVIEPPKTTGAVSFRLAKKRPQYYAGPIEGIGAISNNIKPVIQPVDSTSFHGALFTPQAPQGQTAFPNEEQAVPFDISTAPAANFSAHDINNSFQSATSYDTAFDVSRPAESYDTEPSKQDKGFGIIGSLKSKLSSIDINKIQNTVTTFFDPAYNDSKKEEMSVQKNVPYAHQYAQGFQNNFEIFVPNIQQDQNYQQQMLGQNQGMRQYCGQPSTYEYNQYQSNFSNQTYAAILDTNAPESFFQAPNTHFNENNIAVENTQGIATSSEQSSFLKYNVQNITIEPPKVQSILQPNLNSARSFSDQPKDMLANVENIFLTKVSKMTTQSIESNSETIEKKDIKLGHNIENDAVAMPTSNLFAKSPINEALKQEYLPHEKSVEHKQETENKESDGSKTNKPDVATTALLGLSSMLADKSKELSQLENDLSNLTLKETQSIDSIFSRGDNINFFDNLKLESELNEIKKEEKRLGICETCREVDKPEFKGADDLTTQLIENITSPIQLLNPVEVPFTEDDFVTDVNDFDPKQCAEISHIVEETIETIQVQSAAELLDEPLEDDVGDYGWNTDISKKALSDHTYTETMNASLDEYVPSQEIKESYNMSQIMADQGYSLPNPNSIGFFVHNTSMENLPSNASDEIKAEFQFNHEDSPIVQPRQISVPSAPEEDKFDESGIDVNSIEQDAKNDFPIIEEFVIEPDRETDDDKIEYIGREREKSEDSPQDSFTNRIERFKKLEDTDLPSSFGISATTPSIPMPSYFDTGNYAAETHYRNSLTSPSSLGALSSGITNAPSSNLMNVPPGFEEEYRRRLSNVSSKNNNDNDADVTYIPYIPDCSTQTRPTFSPTFSTAHGSIAVTSESIITAKMTGFVAESKSVVEPMKITSHVTENFAGFSKIPTADEAKRLVSEYFKAEDSKSLIAISALENTQDKVESRKLPDIMNIQSQHVEQRIAEITKPVLTQKEAVENPVLPPSAHHFEATNLTKPESKPTATFKEDSKPNPLQTKPAVPEKQIPLPDHINFFASNSEMTQSNEGFNRLASYFASPEKSNEKPFFELSQSQNHLRQTTPKTDALISTLGSGDSYDSVKSFFELSQSQNHYKDLNLSQDKLVANMKLMQDLTSIDNYELKPEQKVKIVNYFTVEYNNDFKEILADFDKGDPESLIDKDKKGIPKESKQAEIVFDEETLNNVIQNCEYCCDLKYGSVIKIDNSKRYEIFNSEINARKTMDNSSESKRDCDSKMGSNNDTVTRNSVTVEFGSGPDDQSTSEVTALNEKRSTSEYSPVKHHWFYRVDADSKSIWRGFSVIDSKALEDAYHSPDLTESTVVATDGGRFDVNIVGRLRTPVYWNDTPSVVRRCSWFYKGTTDPRYVPYTEPVAEKLEEEYRHGITTGSWHRRLVLPGNELVVMHGPTAMVHFFQADVNDGFASQPLFQFGKRVYRNPPKIRVLRDQTQKIDHLVFLVHGAGEYTHQKQKEESSMRHRMSTRVLRGHDEIEIEDIEPSNIEHLLMLCHGVGSACDMRFRSVEEVVEDFRATSHQLLQSHYRNSYENGTIGRVEVLPISWHSTLHSGETGVDRRLATITLDSIPRLRAFTNDTVLDVLFYTSPVYSQTIIDTVCAELNRIYRLFKTRNPNFTGGVSLGGHSLGSVILYDLLSHQTPKSGDRASRKQYVPVAAVPPPPVRFPQLEFSPHAMYALGSPIAIFECIRGVDSLGLDFTLPTCPKFFNIFHPYDPIAYRIEPLINPQLREVKPLLIPHHKGRKRMHLELKDTMARVGADIKQKLIESIKTTWSSMWKTQPPPDRHLEKVVEEEIEKEQLTDSSKEESIQDPENVATPEMLGRLNSGERVDHVLQEAPLEMINEYIFAMSSHVCYWESEDTMLLMLREIYSSLGVHPDSTVPQQSLTVHRTRTVKNDETIVVNTSDFPSTSRDGT